MESREPDSYQPIDDVGLDIERAAWRVGYTTWAEWCAEDPEAAYEAFDQAGVVVPDRDPPEEGQ